MSAALGSAQGRKAVFVAQCDALIHQLDTSSTDLNLKPFIEAMMLL